MLKREKLFSHGYVFRFIFLSIVYLANHRSSWASEPELPAEARFVNLILFFPPPNRCNISIIRLPPKKVELITEYTLRNTH